MIRKWLLLTCFMVGSIVGLSGSSSADQQRIVLLTSLDPHSIQIPWYRPWSRMYYGSYESRLESEFRTDFKELRYELEVVHRATQHDLWTALHHPRNVAVFWVSHAGDDGNTTCSSSPLGTQGMIFDHEGFDVSPIFFQVHPNLRYLAVIGCGSLKVLREHGIEKLISAQPELKVFGFNIKTDALEGLEEAVVTGLGVLEDPSIRRGYKSACSVEQGIPVQVKRTFSTAVSKENSCESPFTQRPAVRIETEKGKVLGMFPKACAHDWEETLTFHLPFPLQNLKVAAGENLQIKSIGALTLGEFEFAAPDGLNPWKVWRGHNGSPIGITSHIFEYQGNAQDLSKSLESYIPFRCESMPAY